MRPGRNARENRSAFVLETIRRNRLTGNGRLLTIFKIVVIIFPTHATHTQLRCISCPTYIFFVRALIEVVEQDEEQGGVKHDE